MAKFTFGEEEWSGNGDESLFLRLDKEKTNQVRVCGSPYRYNIHWTKNKLDKPRKIKCSCSEDCPVCQKVQKELPALEAAGKTLSQHKEKCKPAWFVVVLDRRDENKVKILEIGTQIKSAIGKFASKPGLGSPDRFDVCIDINKNNPREYYSVSLAIDNNGNVIKDPITATERKRIDEFISKVDFESLITPDTPEHIMEVLGWTDGDISGGNVDIESHSDDECEIDNSFNSSDNSKDEDDFINFN